MIAGYKLSIKYNNLLNFYLKTVSLLLKKYKIKLV